MQDQRRGSLLTREYFIDLHKETGLLGCRVAETPIEPNLKLLVAKVEEIKEREQYQRLVGRLIYFVTYMP